MDVLKKEIIYTMDDIYALPKGVRAELIDGRIYYIAPPSVTHQRMVDFFDREIGNYIQSHEGECEVFPAPFAVFLSEDDRNYVEPDISVICDPARVNDNSCNGAPDWIIEIVAPNSRKTDYYKKLFKYRTAGVKEYWVVDTDKQLVTVYDFWKDNMEEYTFGVDIPVGIFKDFSINVQ